MRDPGGRHRLAAPGGCHRRRAPRGRSGRATAGSPRRGAPRRRRPRTRARGRGRSRPSVRSTLSHSTSCGRQRVRSGRTACQPDQLVPLHAQPTQRRGPDVPAGAGDDDAHPTPVSRSPRVPQGAGWHTRPRGARPPFPRTCVMPDGSGRACSVRSGLDRGALGRRGADLDLARLRALGHGDAQAEDAAVVVGLDPVEVEVVAEDQLTAEDAARDAPRRASPSRRCGRPARLAR